MDRLFEFIGNHLFLSALFVVLWGVLISVWVRGKREMRALEPSEAIGLLSHNNALIVDIRSENEFHNGHIINSIHIPSSYLKDRLSKFGKHRNRPIIMVCAVGRDTGKAGALLKDQGFKEVLRLNGGIAAWRNANYPLTKK